MSVSQFHVSQMHGHQLSDMGMRLQDLLNGQVMYSNAQPKRVVKEIGHGTFSNVFLVQGESYKMAMKYLVPTASPERIAMEIDCLRMCAGKCNVIPLIYCERMGFDVVLGFPYHEPDRFSDLVRTVNIQMVAIVMKNLLIALKHVHSFGIIHRDVKPANFLISLQQQKFALIDFGLAQYVKKPEPANFDFEKPNGNSISKTIRDAEASPKGASKGLLQKGISLLRRSPRKHTPSTKSPGYSKLTISQNTILGASPKSIPISRTPSFTMLDPQSGVPSGDATTSRLNASVTPQSHHAPSSASKPRFTTPTLIDRAKCCCYGLGKVCAKCTERRRQKVARAGTPGFRPPEVLLKYEHQTTAVDIWAAGVIMLSLMSRTYPFFKAPDDMGALAEFICIFGTEKIQEVAKYYGKKLTSSELRRGLQWKDVIIFLARRDPDQTENPLYTPEACDLLSKLLDPFSGQRISAAEALEHPFLKNTVI